MYAMSKVRTEQPLGRIKTYKMIQTRTPLDVLWHLSDLGLLISSGTSEIDILLVLYGLQ